PAGRSESSDLDDARRPGRRDPGCSMDVPGQGEPSARERETLDSIAHSLRTPRAAGIAGLVFSTLFVVSILLLYRQPAKGSSAAEIASWYLQHNAKTLGIVGLYLTPFAGIAFLWFVAAVRSRIGIHEDRLFATVFLAAGILFVAMLFAAAATAGASLAAVK